MAGQSSAAGAAGDSVASEQGAAGAPQSGQDDDRIADRADRGAAGQLRLSRPRRGNGRLRCRRSVGGGAGAAAPGRAGLEADAYPQHPPSSRSHRRQPRAEAGHRLHRSSATATTPRAFPASMSAVEDGDEVALGASRARVLDVSGHTIGHIAYWFREDECAVLRRYPLLAGLRPAVRGQPRPDVGEPQQAARSAGRDARLLWPRVHREQRPLRAVDRSRQPRAAPPRRRGAGAAGAGPADGAVDCSAASGRPIRFCAPTIPACSGRPGWRRAIRSRPSPRSAAARTPSDLTGAAAGRAQRSFRRGETSP